MGLRHGAMVFAALALGCIDYGGGGGGGGGGTPSGQNVAAAFTNALAIPGVTVTASPMPPDDAGLTGPTVTVVATAAPVEVRLAPSDAGTASGSKAVTLLIPYQGGGVGSVNIGFGTATAPPTSFFAVPTPMAAGVSSGLISLQAQVQATFCSGLAVQNVCHQIKCYEQVVTPAGSFSKATALQMVINCTGQDCNGNPVAPADAGTCGSCPAGQTCLNGACVSPTTCAARCCPGRNDSCTLPGASCMCDDYCTTAGDCCPDFQMSCH